MPAYNPPQQVLFSPVTNYYQGKAIRTQQAMAEKELETYDQKLALDERRVAAQENAVATREEANALAREKMEFTIGLERTKKTAYDLYSITKKHNDQFAAAGRTPEAMEETLKNVVPDLQAYADNLPEELVEGKQALNQYLADGVVTPDEWRAMTETAQTQARYYFPEMFGKNTATLSKNQKIVDLDTGETVASNMFNERETQAKSLAGKFTGASIDKWIKTGEYSDLVPLEGSGLKDFKPTERGGKAMSWLNQALTGNQLMEDYLASDMEIRWDEVAKYLVSISEDASPWTRQGMREFGLTQDELNFFDAVNLLVDPVVRQSTGAAVKNFEFAQWFNTLIPMSTDPSELAQKSFARKRVISGLALEAGEGAQIVYEQHQADPMPNFVDPTGSGQMDSLESEFGYIPSPMNEEEYKEIPVGAKYNHPSDPPGSPPRIKK